MSIATTTAEFSAARSDRPVAYWLVLTAVMIVAMVVIGGITRLTLSGLSITEWKLVTGILPPLTQAGWEDAFAKYQQIPEYREIHTGMTLQAFKGIYFWEYLHRLLGRAIGMVGLVPPFVFLAQGRIGRDKAVRYLAVPVLIGLQGLLGWYMVKSGLSVRTSVSQYRLTAHLGLAVLAYGYVVWLAADILSPGSAADRRIAVPPWLLRAGGLLAGLVFLTILAGGFTAGLKAGLTYNTFPLMDGRLVPEGYLTLQPWYRNLFENIAAVQFDHRCLAIATLSTVLGLRLATLRRALPKPAEIALNLMVLMVLLQVGLGISTLLLVVPVPLAAAHQTCAVLLFTTALLTAHGLRIGGVSRFSE